MGSSAYIHNIVLTKDEYSQWGKTGIILDDEYYDLREEYALIDLYDRIDYKDMIKEQEIGLIFQNIISKLQKLQNNCVEDNKGNDYTELTSILAYNEMFVENYDIYSNEQTLKNYLENKRYNGYYEVVEVENSVVIIMSYSYS